MLLPTKGIASDRALVFLGAQILQGLDSPSTVSALWTRVMASHPASGDGSRITYDWFVLAIDWLFIARAIRLDEFERIVAGHGS
jgi:hypothetical protein